MSASRCLAGRAPGRGEGRFEAGAAVVIPIGAASKAHGPHLPLKTDAAHRRGPGAELIERPPVSIAAPSLASASIRPSLRLHGASISPRILSRRCLPSSWAIFRGHGVSRIALMNTGVSTERPIDEAGGGATAPDPPVLHMRGLGRPRRPPARRAQGGGHADERETSVTLALEPAQRPHGQLAPRRSFREHRRHRRSDPSDAPSRASGCSRRGWTTSWRQ